MEGMVKRSEDEYYYYHRGEWVLTKVDRRPSDSPKDEIDDPLDGVTYISLDVPCGVDALVFYTAAVRRDFYWFREELF